MSTTAQENTWARRRSTESPPSGSRRIHGPDASTRSGRLTRLARGDDSDPHWARPALFALLTLASVVYCWDLTNSGYANEFYAAAVKSGTKSWEAWFFGSLDSSNAITVDKPPASLWIMGLSARLFGFSSFSLLLPQALMGIGTVYLTYATVRRWSGHAAGLLAGLLLTLTPVAALMFRFDNPDALLVLLMTAAAYCVTRALGSDHRALSARVALSWMIGAGLLIGFAFLTKMLQGLLVLPGMGLAYLIAARYSLKTRIAHLVAATLGVLVGAGWLIAVEAAWPAASRPYIGGSTNNSLWDLAIGYNGLGRIMGGAGNAGGMGGGGGFGGTPGLLRMFNSQFGTEISWLLPTSLILLVAGLLARGRARRTDRVRASLILWGGWLVVTTLCLSFMEGTVHSYYAVALAPAIAACIAIGGREAWNRRGHLAWRCVLAVSVCLAAIWSFRLMSTTASNWLPWLRWVSVVLAVVGAMVFVAAHGWSTGRIRRFATVGLIVGVLGALGGSSAWTFSTITSGHTGSMPTAGPVAASGVGGMSGGGMGSGKPDGGGGASAQTGSGAGSGPGSSNSGAKGGATGSKPSGAKPSGTQPSGTQPAGSQPAGTTPAGGAAANSSTKNSAATSTEAAGASDGQTGSNSPGGGGTDSNNAALVKLLNATASKWSAAVIGDQAAAGYILNSDTAVMSIGGWSGSDNNVTLAQFQAYVKSGDIHYFIAGGGMGGGQGNNGAGAQITAWVKAHYQAKTVGGVTVYDLTKATS